MRALILLAIAGCSFDTRIPPGELPEAGVVPDGPAGCAAWTFQPKDFDPCAIAAPADPPQLFTGTYIINSDTGVMSGAGGPFQLPYQAVGGVGVVSLSGLVLQSTVNIRGQGMKALVIAAWGSMQLDGNIDVSSTPSNTGAGANPAACATAGQGAAGIATNGGDGGGGGGGFGANGGKGGNGNNSTTNGGPGGTVRAPTTLAGGCPGGSAPIGDGGTPGKGGAGGGAIALVARDTLAIAGIVHAGGAGGGGGAQSQTGGGGGGSGGMIRLEAAAIALADSAILAANGGQGGGGCDGAAAFEGQSGRAAAGEALQGNNQGAGADGGGGGWRDRLTGATPNTSSEGGGGGGGGVGHIVYKGHTSTTGIGTATASPPAQPF